MTTEVWIAIIGGVALIITWSVTLASILIWLDGRFGELYDRVGARLAIDVYETKHRELSERVRKIELWAAKQNGIEY